MLVDWLAVVALATWLAVLLLPSRAWGTAERLEMPPSPADEARPDPGRVCVLIPARNEAVAIGATLRGLAAQGTDLAVIVIDDQSDDGTARAASEAASASGASLSLTMIPGEPLPAGWGGKLWALEQGLSAVSRDYCLLLDAEIVLAPGVIAALLRKASAENRALVSVMARLRCASVWEKWLVPPFIFFFKLLYPFARVNDPRMGTAAAAGGCILVRTDVLRQIGAFGAMRDALIDDCTLATKVKQAGHSIWLGLSEAVASTRSYPDLASFRRMVTRTAFTQLRYSGLLLGLVCLLMTILFLLPPLALVVAASPWGRLAGAGALAVEAGVFWPVVRFYRLPWWRALTLPVAAFLFMAMTVESAVRYWRGVRAEWKGRTYPTRLR